MLVPTLRPGDTIILDTLAVHKGPAVRQTIEAAGATLLFLSPYSPDYHPIEQVFAKLKSFRHRGLKRFYETGSLSGIQARQAPRLRLQLAALDTAQTVADMDIPGYRLHRLKGKLHRRWAIRVSGNWRLTFAFAGGDIHVLDYEDYHS